MSAFLCKPLAFTVFSGAASTINLNDDRPGLAYTSTSATTAVFIVNIGAGVTIDTVALVGSNLTAADTMKVELSDASGITSPLTYTVNGYTGNKDSGRTTITISRFTAVAKQYIRITLTASSAKVFRAQRLVVGKAVVTNGIDIDAVQTFTDRSVSVGGLNVESFEEYAVVPSLKFKVSNISDAAWKDEWSPLLRSIGVNKGVLVVTDDVGAHQNDMLFGRLTASASGTVAGYDYWVADLNITALAA